MFPIMAEQRTYQATSVPALIKTCRAPLEKAFMKFLREDLADFTFMIICPVVKRVINVVIRLALYFTSGNRCRTHNTSEVLNSGFLHATDVYARIMHLMLILPMSLLSLNICIRSCERIILLNLLVSIKVK